MCVIRVLLQIWQQMLVARLRPLGTVSLPNHQPLTAASWASGRGSLTTQPPVRQARSAVELMAPGSCPFNYWRKKMGRKYSASLAPVGRLWGILHPLSRAPTESSPPSHSGNCSWMHPPGFFPIPIPFSNPDKNSWSHLPNKLLLFNSRHREMQLKATMK